ncbi:MULTISPECIES: DNA polymerase III subunit beta [Pseudobutyrivibrio]|jgi:DNA polymerase-3 subunit beta|uniref:Beta sliding clamp n=2 Tax=Pseudobutyrivibrio TaxID=46205 RepID=A0A2G3EB96_9FIRM|nr:MULTISPECIES: DNA polymerase III subunit beta [Pseudobutyrivibrio]MBE5904429.1 DNA polymerase III subunit beta [Pseudobutyrivibrio sp.]NEX02064.1 DNA polymerase III subunit beta [Pseudobutyrivibrio xylanivorans]PHU40598.1 DNA polymerase III subunit beta [Pseudobutyrivibrio ruminis]SCY11776.1 DNA polymerase-3 subunit beta [Pseudobutyrivibrio sp. AR14]SFR74038.1 DNA polymerase-3 subunit beta [Pseudobutyrivibrio sp. NOR37]
MKIRCQKADLLKGVNFVSKAVPTKTTMAILECILIDASSGEIKLTANNMELGIETIINGTIEERGIVALDAKIFSDIVRKLPDNEVTIETDASFNTKITCEKAKFFNVGKSGEDFSYIPVVTRNQPIIISQYTLREIIRKTIFTVPDKDNNKMMTGELLEIKDGKLKAVALDGHRVSIRYVDLKDATNDVNVVVPKNTLNEIIKIIDGGVDDFVNIFVTDNHIVFEFDQTTVVSRIIQGEFFKIEQMLSADYETKVKINKKDLLDCIDRANTIVNEGDKKPIIVNVSDNVMSLSVTSFIGSMNEDIDIVKEGKDIMIGFNPKFVMDALKAIDDEEINLYMLNAKSPCFIKDDEGTYIYIVLPVNFNNPGAN